MVHNGVELLPLPPGDTVQSMIPLNYTLTKVEEVGDGSVMKEKSAICCVVEKMEEQINTAKHMVAINRTRCILMEIESQERSYCWFFGPYSDSMARLGMREKDLVMICCPTVVRTKLKPKQVLPPNLSTWTIHCLERDPQPSVTFFRLEDQELRQEVEVQMNTLQDQQLLDESHLVEEMNNPPRNLLARETIQSRILSPPKQVKPPPKRPQYSSLSSCNIHKARYNLYAVLSEVVETPRRRKSKIVARLNLLEESLFSCGDLREHFRFDILADSMEQVPVLVVGAVLRIHHMVVEVFNGCPDGRVFSGQCVTVVEGGVGDAITPVNTRKTDDLIWDEEDDRRVGELRKWMQDRMVEEIRIVRTIEDILEECETDLSCRVVTSSRVEEGLVLRVEDGTCSQQVSVEYRGQDTMTQEEAGNNKHFIDVWVTSSVLVDRIGRQDIVAGDWLRMDRVKCVREIEDGDLPAVFRFILDAGEIHRLGDGDLAVACMMERLGENMLENQADSYLDRILTAVNMEGSFTCPDSASGQVENMNEELPPDNTAINTKGGGTESEEVIEQEAEYEDVRSSALEHGFDLAIPSVYSESTALGSTSVLRSTSTEILSPLTVSIATPASLSLPDVLLPSPDSEISFPHLEKTLSFSKTPHQSPLNPPSLPLGQCPPSILHIPESMCSQMSQFDLQTSPLRHSISPPLSRDNSSPSQQFFTPSGSPRHAEGRPDRRRVEEGEDSSKDHEDVEIDISNQPGLEDFRSDNIRKKTISDPDSLNSFRKHLMVVCHPLTSSMPRVDCTRISSIGPGRVRMLGWISRVEQDEKGQLQLVRGMCQECGKLDRVDMFEQRGLDIFCCKRGRVTIRAKKILYVGMYVTDQVCGVGEEVKLVVRGEEAEMFLGCSSKQFVVDIEVRDIVEDKVMRLMGALGDFGVEKSVLGDLNVVDSAILDK